MSLRGKTVLVKDNGEASSERLGECSVTKKKK